LGEISFASTIFSSVTPQERRNYHPDGRLVSSSNNSPHNLYKK